jgi:hypothetical protein
MPNAQGNATQTDTFLKYAPLRHIAITGTLPLSSTGGANAYVTWQSLPPETPVWCTSVDFFVSWKLNIVVPTTQAFTISPFAPYAAFSNQFTIAGAPTWPLIECTPFLFEYQRSTRGFDMGYLGLGQNAGYLANVVDTGPYGQNFDAAAVAPGVATTNAATTSATYTLTWVFCVHIELQRKRSALWGAIPLGDPKNRLNTLFQLNNLIGTQPEQNLIVVAGAGVTAALDGTTQTTVIACYNVRDIDILPNGVATPSPQVELGYTINSYTQSITSAGIIYPMQHIAAMAYEAVHHVLVNVQVPIRPDYMGLWLTQEQKAARYDFDSQANTLAEYWERYRRQFQRYPYKGHFQIDLTRGAFPDIPSLDPYDGLMTPDSTYGDMFGVKATPSWQTAIRIATGTGLTNAYVREYEVGLVKVGY